MRLRSHRQSGTRTWTCRACCYPAMPLGEGGLTEPSPAADSLIFLPSPHSPEEPLCHYRDPRVEREAKANLHWPFWRRWQAEGPCRRGPWSSSPQSSAGSRIWPSPDSEQVGLRPGEPPSPVSRLFQGSARLPGGCSRHPLRHPTSAASSGASDSGLRAGQSGAQEAAEEMN